MMMKEEGKLVIWPAYLNREKTRAQGRVISRKSAVNGPTLDEITAAAQKLGFSPVVQKDKAYPASWWEKSGRILIDNTMQKNTHVRQIAAEIKKIRGN